MGRLPRRRRMSRRRRWTLADRCLRSLWRSLVAFGATYAGPTVYFNALPACGPAAHPLDPAALFVRAGLPPGTGGPPPAHPERLREDAPLTEAERLLARELWPAYYSARRAPGDG
ncbi:DUF6059 family protein [Streptomyces sp. NPDC051207]|uniref:DUF6059 family protein n=1 Tax=Streptomyces sp. NPDC051207 TaxID=3154641 RepID=UPI00341B2952